MPLMSVYIGFVAPAGLSVYWIVQGVFSLVWQNPYIDPGSGMPGNAWSECFPVCEENLNETRPVFVTVKASGALRPTYGYRIVVGRCPPCPTSRPIWRP